MSARKSGQLRIIGGDWRSRRVEFEAGEGVRPTPDRVRQTVFDWLAAHIEGARCLDLFAGSGALGFEALSRGAAHVTFVEAGRGQANAIAASLRKLDAASRAELYVGDALAQLPGLVPAYDVVFLDPPYASDLLARVLPLLPRLLKPEARVYIEWSGSAQPPLPAGYAWVREKSAGRINFGLLTTATGASA